MIFSCYLNDSLALYSTAKNKAEYARRQYTVFQDSQIREFIADGRTRLPIVCFYLKNNVIKTTFGLKIPAIEGALGELSAEVSEMISLKTLVLSQKLECNLRSD